MEKIVNRLQQLLQEVPARFCGLNEAQLSDRPAPGKWSKKEILGHLCDSAANNHQRFIRVQYTAQPFIVEGYDQDKWVAAQAYQELAPADIIQWWLSLNQHLLRIITRLAGDEANAEEVPGSPGLCQQTRLGWQCQLPDGRKVTLQWLIEDYLDHMEHHLAQMFDNKG